jgi:hypothetical protein
MLEFTESIHPLKRIDVANTVFSGPHSCSRRGTACRQTKR